MKRLEEVAELACWIRTVSDRWTQFVEFSFATDAVRAVKQVDKSNLYLPMPTER